MVLCEGSATTAFSRRKRKVTLHLLTAMDVTGDGQYSMQSSPIAIGEVRLGGRNNYTSLDDAAGCGPRPCTTRCGPRPCTTGIVDSSATAVEAAQGCTNTAVLLDSCFVPLPSSLCSLLCTLFFFASPLFFLLSPLLFLPSSLFSSQAKPRPKAGWCRNGSVPLRDQRK